MLKLANLRVGIALIWNFDLAKHVQTLQIFKIRSVYEFAKFYKQAQSTHPLDQILLISMVYTVF